MSCSNEMLNNVLLLETVLKKGLPYDDFWHQQPGGHAVRCMVLGAAQDEGTRRTELFVPMTGPVLPRHIAE